MTPRKAPLDFRGQNGFVLGRQGLDFRVATGVPLLANGDRFGVIGDSQTYCNGGTPQSWWMWDFSHLGGRVYFPATSGVGTTAAIGGNMGVSGESTTQIQARKANFNTADLDIYTIMSGENDPAGFTAADTITAYLDILGQPNLLAAKRIYVMPQPYSRSVASNPTLQTRRAAMEAWGLKNPADGDATPSNCLRKGIPNALWIPSATLYAGTEWTRQVHTTSGLNVFSVVSGSDPAVGDILSNGSSSPFGSSAGLSVLTFDTVTHTGTLSGNANATADTWCSGTSSYDGVHPNPIGARVFSANRCAVQAAETAPGNIYDQGRTNLNTVSVMAGTGGSGTVGSPTTGTPGIATGYAASNTTGATVAWSKVTRDGKTYQRVEISGTASTSSVVRLRRTVSVAITTGDILEGALRPKLKNIAGDGPAVGMKGWQLATQSNARWISASYADTIGPIAPVSDFDFTADGVCTQCWAAGTTAGSFTADVDIQVKTGVTLDIAFEWTDEEIYNRTVEGSV